MARYTGPKNKLSRREGFDLFSRGAKLTRLTVPPGEHGPKGTTKLSEYGRQLRQKQKMKRFYGILEKQFERYVEKAGRIHGKTGEELIKLLETRLDNVVFRLGFAPTRPAARQLVSHKHVFVNDSRVTIPSYQVKVGDVISLTPKAQKVPYIAQLFNEKLSLPGWLERKGTLGKISRLPKRDDVAEPLEEQSIIEYYSR